MNLKHNLMHNNLLKSDMSAIKKVIKSRPLILTQSKKVKEFEKKWSNWLGVKYSTFVNSGSSANFITISILLVSHPSYIKIEHHRQILYVVIRELLE